MNRLKFLPLLFLLLLASCADIKEVECVGTKGFKINKVSTTGIEAEIMLTIRNPNNFGFKIYKSEFDVSYGGIKLGKAKLAKNVKIGRNKEETYPFMLNGDFKGMALTDIMKALESFQRKSFLEVKGDLKVGRMLYKKTFPVNVKERISTD